MQAPMLPALPGYDNPELIAHGTTALVFRATQTRLNRLVAIKVIIADTGSAHINPARELATTVALSSQPHIVSIIDTGVTEDDRPYIVMEYCEGGSYTQILRQRGPLPVDEVIDVGIKIGEALHAAHQVGIVHRDVKPSNILRSRFGPALTDFGIARAPDELSGTLTREMMTPHHASPEALLHQAQSGLSDVYSLASTMWTLLIGHPPYVDPEQPLIDIYAFRDRVLHDQLPPMTREDVPGWLVTELTRGLAKLPAQRHTSALDFVEALRRGSLGLAPAQTPAAVPHTTGDVHVPGMPAQAWPALPAEAMGMPPLRPDGVRADAAPHAPGDSDSLATHPPTHPPSGRPQVMPIPARPVSAPPLPPAAAPPLPIPPVAATYRSRRSVPQAQHPPAVGAFPVEADIDDEDGWLGPATTEPPTRVPFERRFTSTRRFDERDLVRAGKGRGGLVAALVAIAVVAIAAAAVLSLVARSGSKPPLAGTVTNSPTPSGTRFVTAAPEGAPRAVKLDDRGTSVVVSWTDPTSGSVPFVVTGRSAQGDPIGLRQVRPSVTSASYSGLDPKVDYCFLVTAVYSSTRVAPSGWTCTTR